MTYGRLDVFGFLVGHIGNWARCDLHDLTVASCYLQSPLSEPILSQYKADLDPAFALVQKRVQPPSSD